MQHQADTAPDYGLALVRNPPAVRGGIGQIRVDPAYRRRGYGRVLIATALTPDYDWSTTKVD